MHVVLELIVVLLRVTCLWVVAIFKAIVPASWQGYKDVRGQIVLITGAGSGLGRLMSMRFASQGSKLVLWDISESGNEETARIVKQLGAEVHTYTVDLSQRTMIYKAAEKVKAEVGTVDILVNNAGIVTGRKFLDCPDELIEKTMDVNANAHFWTAKSFLPAMLERNHGHIVSIASSAGFFGVNGLADYCASKFAAVGFDESLRNELIIQGKTGVKTTVVCPYFIDTGMFSGVSTRFSWLLPILKPEAVVDSIMDAVLTNQVMLTTPKSVYLLLALRGLVPCDAASVMGDFIGATSSMDTFVGRDKAK